MIGKVVDALALTAIARGDLEAAAWLATANSMASTLGVPELAFVEVAALRPDLERDLEDLRTLPPVVVKSMAGDERVAVEELLARAGVFDVLAGQVGSSRVSGAGRC